MHTPARCSIVLSIAAAVVTAAPLGCTTLYQDTIRDMAQRTPANHFSLRAVEARQSLQQTRDAFIQLDDALRQHAMAAPPADAAEAQHAELMRLYQHAETQAWEARRRMASVHDVAPAYLEPAPRPSHETVSHEREVEHPAPLVARAYSDVMRSFQRAEGVLITTTEALERDLPALGAAPRPRTADHLRAEITVLLTALNDAINDASLLIDALEDPTIPPPESIARR